MGCLESADCPGMMQFCDLEDGLCKRGASILSVLCFLNFLNFFQVVMRRKIVQRESFVFLSTICVSANIVHACTSLCSNLCEHEHGMVNKYRDNLALF